TELMKAAVHATYTPEVLSETGAFGGLYDASALKAMDAPVLVASTDGVGTKTMVAAKMGRWNSIGQDLVNHCVNDILVQGARPLFFLDYVASSKLNPEQIVDVVGGCAKACREIGVALLGGETAEMPGVYQPGEIDVAGTIVGVVERGRILDGSRIQPGDMILALPSNGLHTNGFSLARNALAALDWSVYDARLGASIGDALLRVHRCYLREIQTLWNAGIDVRGLAHITGGGVVDNLPRILPDGIGAVIQRGTWQEPPIFGLIQAQGDVPSDEMFHAFNMGLGMLVVIPAIQVMQAQAVLPELMRVGEIIRGESVSIVTLDGLTG
ncbi:MAG TPA: phosphoribosylformylglycinamidine cyclo-ligase, partial [Phototrophicaceae bacterium]|nr:phosphoribosylformylglycinamidine cyclo-ligase [Phototrophicaceae bacterium]